MDLAAEEHRQILAALRRARYGDLLALHLLVLGAAGRAPTAIAVVLCCARSSVYRTVHADRQGTLGGAHAAPGRLLPPLRTMGLVPTRRRSLVSRLKAAPRAYGWCRTRWRCATRALTLQAERGGLVSAATRRRGRHELGWGWKRTKLVAKDDAPPRVGRLARLRFVDAQWPRCEAIVLAEALNSPRLPQVGWAWMPKGTPVEVMTPGQHPQHDLAGALELATGTLHDGLGPRQTNALFRDLRPTVEAADPTAQDRRIAVVVENSQLQKATAVEDWLAPQPRVTLLVLPTSCPRATPIERACGKVHELCPRHHTRKR